MLTANRLITADYSDQLLLYFDVGRQVAHTSTCSLVYITDSTVKQCISPNDDDDDNGSLEL